MKWKSEAYGETRDPFLLVPVAFVRTEGTGTPSFIGKGTVGGECC